MSFGNRSGLTKRFLHVQNANMSFENRSGLTKRSIFVHKNYFASNDPHHVWGTWGLSCHRRMGRRKGRMEEGRGRLRWDIWGSGA